MNLSLGSAALALVVGFGVPSSDAAEVRQPPFACDESGDGFIDADEARLCREREFDRMSADETALTEDRLSAMSEAEEGVGPAFAEVDADGDGAISREEWIGFGARRFARAADASDGRMSVQDYDRWRQEGMQP